MLLNMIGMRLVNIEHGRIVLADKYNHNHTVTFNCYFDSWEIAEVEATLITDDVNALPVITSIETRSKINNRDEDDSTGMETVITLFGMSKPLAEINAYAGSDSGYKYGATVAITCESLSVDEDIAAW